jgi:hypothetical protein
MINGLTIDDEGQRLLANLAQHYDAWLDAVRRVEQGQLAWKRRSGREYLYRRNARQGIDTSLGPRNEETEQLFEAYQIAAETRKGTEGRLTTDAALYRALRLPQIPGFAGDVLRELDRRRLLDTSFLVVGTNALVAYAIAALRTFPPGMDTTDDFDLTWAAPVLADAIEPPNALLAALKAVDGTYTINTERQFQIRNAKGQEVELLLPAAVAEQWSAAQKIRPVPLPEQDWLLKGRPVSHVICDTSGRAARVAAPDPRWFGLHKLWLAEKPGRDPIKKPKDARQGAAVLDIVADAMPHFPLDDALRAELPEALTPFFDRWAENRRARLP